MDENNYLLDNPAPVKISRWKQWTSDPAISYALTAYILQRVILSVLGAILVPFVPPLLSHRVGYIPAQDVHNDIFSFLFLSPWQRWDNLWYIDIAIDGYSRNTGSTDFVPLFPMLVAGIGRVLFGQYMLAALLVSNVAYLTALVYFYRLTKRLFDIKRAEESILFLIAFPTAFFLASGYTDSLYLALLLMAFYYAEEQRWLLVALLAALAPITRLQGVILVLPLGFLYLQQRGWNWRKLDWKIIPLLLSPLTLGIYLLYVYLIVGDTNFSSSMSQHWDIKLVFPGVSLFDGITHLFNFTDSFDLLTNLIDLTAIIIFVSMTVIWARQKLPAAYLIYSVLTILIFLTREGTIGYYWMSITRYFLAIFPAFMLFGKYGTRRMLILSVIAEVMLTTFFIFSLWAG